MNRKLIHVLISFPLVSSCEDLRMEGNFSINVGNFRI